MVGDAGGGVGESAGGSVEVLVFIAEGVAVGVSLVWGVSVDVGAGGGVFVRVGEGGGFVSVGGGAVGTVCASAVLDQLPPELTRLRVKTAPMAPSMIKNRNKRMGDSRSRSLIRFDLPLREVALRLSWR